MEPLEAWGQAHTWEEMTRIAIAYHNTFAYQWFNGRIRYPLSLEESRSRQNILAACWRLLGNIYTHSLTSED